MCSGPLAGFKSAEPIMREMASAMVLYLGEQNGRAQTLKLLNNLLSATGMATTCEAFVLGVKGGLDPQVMLDVFNAGESIPMPAEISSRARFYHDFRLRREDGHHRQGHLACCARGDRTRDSDVDRPIGAADLEVRGFAGSP